jgi:sister-chromatid-cohesion protein PDS5
MHGGVDCVARQARRLMGDFVEDYRREALRAMSGPAERTTITLHPEYALVYLVHVLAHHPNYPVACGGGQPEASAYEPFYR